MTIDVHDRTAPTAERTLVDRIRAYLDELRRRAARPRARDGARDPMTQRAQE